ncbi:hypothetical protein RIF29_26324 [Crotalaria pallida]|uniref:Uncharacterized protein n=1 Tax=Crotalaria pallida TaxID=3830 RepID=A0AAN9I4S3_CROPI
MGETEAEHNVMAVNSRLMMVVVAAAAWLWVVLEFVPRALSFSKHIIGSARCPLQKIGLRHEELVFWQVPREGYLKLNVDGSLKRSNNTACNTL